MAARNWRAKKRLSRTGPALRCFALRRYAAPARADISASWRGSLQTPAPLPVSSLRGRRSFVTDRNAADAARWILENDATFGERYLVAEAEPATAAQFIAKLREARGAPARIFGAPRFVVEIARRLPGLGGMIERLDRDLVVRSSALDALGWRPLEAAEEGLRRMMRSVN